MDQADLILTLTRPLDELDIRYMATGSVASTFYGVPRFTHDVDLVLELPQGMASSLERAFPQTAFYCPPAEVIQVENHRPLRGHFNLIHHQTGFKADVYLVGRDPLHAWGLERRRRIDLSPAGVLWLAPPEYVILRKLEFYREGHSPKHLDDIRGMLEVSGDSISRETIMEWAPKLELEKQWLKVGVQ